MTIGEKIAYIVRVFEGNDKTAFARKIGIPGGSTGLAHDWMNGKAKPKQGYRSKICEAYADKGIDMEWHNDDGMAMPPLPIDVRRMSLGEFEETKKRWIDSGWHFLDAVETEDGRVAYIVSNASAPPPASPASDGAEAGLEKERLLSLVETMQANHEEANRRLLDALDDAHEIAKSAQKEVSDGREAFLKSLRSLSERLGREYMEPGLGASQNENEKIFQIQDNNKTTKK
jgi:vacuolar-type H+-ATPase subunit H